MLINNIPSAITKRHLTNLSASYQISNELFKILAPYFHIHIDGRIPEQDTFIVYEEQMKVGLRFPIDQFYMDVLTVHKLYTA